MTQNRDVMGTSEKFESSSPHHSFSAESRLTGLRREKRARSGWSGWGYVRDTRSKFDSSAPIAERLIEQTTVEGDCLVWTGNKSRDGYGRVQIYRRKWSTHRLSWMLHHGPIAPGLVVMHTCDNPACVRIEHLRIGTHLENIIDRDTKGRGRFPVRRGGRYVGEHRPASGKTPPRSIVKNRRRRISLGK